jgi:hypothetical protein
LFQTQPVYWLIRLDISPSDLLYAGQLVDLNILFLDFRLIKTPFDPKWKQTAFDQLLI